MQQPSPADSTQARLICSAENLDVIHWSEPTVEANLAIDERLAKEAARSEKRTVRLWWGSNPTAVLGCADKPESALDLDECELRGIGWVKRVSGGGAVLQTRGVFNYSYTAPSYGRMDMLRVFEQGAELISLALAQFGINARQRGISDVAVDDFKISGNAQARKWKSVLLHGTLLIHIDRELMRAVLRHPQKEPDYRNGRAHSDFIVTLNDLRGAVGEAQVEAAFASAAIEVFGKT